MTMYVQDPAQEGRIVAERRVKDLDRYDEVWDGAYVKAPLANNEHQELATVLAAAIRAAHRTARTRAGGGGSERE